MKNIKNILIYGVIIVLCIAAFAGYLIKSKSAKEASKSSDNSTLSGTVNSSSKLSPEEHVKAVMEKSAQPPDQNPVVGIGRGEDYASVTEAAIENAGGLKDIIKKGDTVLIKPNLCVMDTPGSATITDYRVAQKVTDMAYSLGASKVIIAEGSIAGNAFNDIIMEANMYGTIKNVELIDLNQLEQDDCYKLKPEKSLTGTELYIPKVYMDADVVINIAKLKTHCLSDAVVSLSLKNAYGVPPGSIYGLTSKTGLHQLGLIESVIDLNRIRRPDLSIIEGIVGGEGLGPQSNTPVKSNIILAGRDNVALDTAGLTFMGFTIDEIPLVKRAGEENLGTSDLSKIKVIGADLNSIKMKFRKELMIGM